MGRLTRVPFGDGVFIADTSAWVRSNRPAVAGAWEYAVVEGQIATCPIVNVELLRVARDAAEFDRAAELIADLRDVPITRSVTNAALHALHRLSRQGQHRSAPLSDLLIAAAAQDAAVGVLHYDAHYDLLATVLDFESRWIAPRGSLA